MRAALISLTVLLVLGCASAEREGTTQTGARTDTTAEEAAGPVVGTVEVVNNSGDPVVVSARVGNSAEQRLGFLGPGERSIFRVPSGASPTDELTMTAQGQDGRRIDEVVQLVDGRVRWEVPRLP